MARYINPFRPGAGHKPPYLAGRDREIDEYHSLIDQASAETIFVNPILTGLRGVGKTVLLEELQPWAVEQGWRWVSSNLSESSSASEDAIATRLLTDLAHATLDVVLCTSGPATIGYSSQEQTVEQTLDFPTLRRQCDRIAGLWSDKLTTMLEWAWRALQTAHPRVRGVIFSYDEAQTASNHKSRQQYPLSLLLDVFQSLQRKGVRMMLALTGLPTLFPKLVEARTYAERMFHVLDLKRLNEEDSRAAIVKPLRALSGPLFGTISLSAQAIDSIVERSAGYPYFLQFIGKEAVDAYLQGISPIPFDAIERKLDADFFAGRWAKATDRQRQLLFAIAHTAHADEEFSVQALVAQAQQVLQKPFSASHVNQMLVSLAAAGLVYKNRHGRYAFAVPLFGRFVRRQEVEGTHPENANDAGPEARAGWSPDDQ